MTMRGCPTIRPRGDGAGERKSEEWREPPPAGKDARQSLNRGCALKPRAVAEHQLQRAGEIAFGNRREPITHDGVVRRNDVEIRCSVLTTESFRPASAGIALAVVNHRRPRLGHWLSGRARRAAAASGNAACRAPTPGRRRVFQRSRASASTRRVCLSQRDRWRR